MVELQKMMGGGFILEHPNMNTVFTPEDFTEEQRMIRRTTSDFVAEEVMPRADRPDRPDDELTARMLSKAGDIGLLGAEVPEPFGGLGLDKISVTLIYETIGKTPSFSVSFGAHVGIGTLPIVFFGTQEQKRKYLPDLAAGIRIAAYCLTEPASGSDALGAKSTATLSDDGKHYILNGSKAFITNAGFADLFIVYAKIDGNRFSAFIVEKNMSGLTIGSEEKKMGIKGSSTRSLFFENVHIPVENLLGEVGKGHLIAFNILNIGRFKLAAGSLGVSKEALDLSVKYAKTRTQFGMPIAKFNLIGKKLAQMNIQIFVLESMVYRTAGLLDHVLGGIDYLSPDADKQSAEAIAEYAIECSINKVFATETLDSIADEGVQIHGGYGFIQEYKIEHIYRDSRIYRIFEGTNEINRLIIAGTLIKKSLKGGWSLQEKVQSLQSELQQFVPETSFTETLEKETYLLLNGKKIFLFVCGLVFQKYDTNLEVEQELLAGLSDMLIQIYAMESVWLRTKKIMAESGEPQAKNAIQMTQTFVDESFEQIACIAKTALTAISLGDNLQAQLSLLEKLTRIMPTNTLGLKRDIAERVIASEKYTI